MKTLTKAQFIALELQNIVPSVDIADSDFFHNTDLEPPKFESWAAGYCIFSKGEIELEVPFMANGGTESYEEAFEFDVEVVPGGPQFELHGFALVDDNGNALNENETGEIINEFLKGFNWQFHVKQKLPEAGPAEVFLDATDENLDEPVEYTIERDNDRPIRFTGKLVAMADSSPNPARPDTFSGSEGRWCELALYQTKGGKFICEQVDCSRRDGERNRRKAQVCDNHQQVMEFFGFGRLAKRLYECAGIDPAFDVE